MVGKKIRARSEFRFNLEVFRNEGDKEIKFSNLPLSTLEQVTRDLKEKYD